MLTYEQIRDIATILGWTPEDVENGIAELNDGFMQPDVEYICDPEILAELETDQAGFFYRLSAPGYLDCTEWSGPFLAENDAVADMLSTYAE